MASGQQFTLIRVLEHKRQMEEQRQRELHALSQQQHVAEDSLRLLHQQAREQREAMTRPGGAALDPAVRDSALAYFGSVEDRIARQRDLIAELEARVVESRGGLIEALKERQMLERVQERRASEATVLQQRREANEADDQTSARLTRQRAEQPTGAQGAQGMQGAS